MKVFISRAQFPNSDFQQQLMTAGFEVFGEALIDIKVIPILIIPEADWLFFYSKSGVEHFFSQTSFEKIVGKKIAVMGPGTAKMLKRFHVDANFIGNGIPEDVSKAFGKVASNKKVVFVRAKNSKCSVQKALSDQVEVQDLIVYENNERKSILLPYCDILVFTSPMNVRSYFFTYILHDTQKVVAIGKSTAQELAYFNINKILLPEESSEKGLAEVVLSIK